MQTDIESSVDTVTISKPGQRKWVYDLLLLIILVLGAYFRMVGTNWDDNQHLHPDERFFTWVASDITFDQNLSDYFNTDVSTLNPNNRGHGFYVYGTLPLFIIRYAAEITGQTGYDQIQLVGRPLSAVADLLTVWMVYLIASRLYNRKAGLFASAFYSFAVLPIQLSHFATVDTFTNFFSFLTFYIAVILLTNGSRAVLAGDTGRGENEDDPPKKRSDSLLSVGMYVLFGIALGMAAASKINAVMLAVLLPAAVAIRYFRLAPIDQKKHFWVIVRNLVIAALVSFIVFRIFQPYAFSGPGFFGIKLNPKWLANLKDLATQSTGDVDFPPALQWARRPVWFGLQNLVLWGLGLPLGIFAWAGFIWMGWRMFKGEWQRHALPWVWTGAYFIWQSSGFTPTMRYFMLIYPTLAIIAGWTAISLWEKVKTQEKVGRKVLVVAISGIVLITTLIWAFMFSRIYTRPVTRVAASEWIYQNVPGPINLRIDTPQGTVNQPLAFRFGTPISPGNPFEMTFQPQVASGITTIELGHVSSFSAGSNSQGSGFDTLVVTVLDRADPQHIVAAASITSDFTNQSGDPRGDPVSLKIDNPDALDPGKTYLFRIELTSGTGPVYLFGPVTLDLAQSSGIFQQALPDPVAALGDGQDFPVDFTANASGTLTEVVLPMVVDWLDQSQEKTVQLTISQSSDFTGNLAVATQQSTFAPGNDPRGKEYDFTFDHPVEIVEGQHYFMKVSVTGPGKIALYGSKQANESTWDDALPLPLDHYTPYDYYTGVYRTDLNFEMYWDDNADKLARFETTLDQADYLFISSNRQWGTTVRVPERYPLTTEYYRDLIGCPADKDIIWCYRVAQPGMFQGKLGFELVSVFQSEPNLGNFSINTQFAEEAFTVYDHPKVFIFKKTADYSTFTVRSLLGAVDLTKVIHVTPKQAGKISSQPTKTLMLSPAILAIQQAGGTWSSLFNIDGLQNKYPVVGLILWYLTIALLGAISYPIVRLSFPGLSDRGYPLARTVGMVLLAYLVWLAGSFDIPFSRLTISLVLLLIIFISAFLAYHQREELAAEWKQRNKYFLVVELIFLAFFVFDLLIRIGNPDLWHPYKGGEKPMDFSYFNAVLKSTVFPPYDPWFAGGYINYYYYGYVIVGVLVKWLGIVPSVAYNLILPTLFGLLAIGTFSVAWNLTHGRKPFPVKYQDDLDGNIEDPTPLSFKEVLNLKPLIIGLTSAIGLAVLGNWGTVRMIWQGFQRLVAPGGVIDNLPFLERVLFSIRGFWLYLGGAHLAFYPGDWYWIPSRAIPGDVITEFPFFTFLYADLHAHMIALPLTVAALSWAVSVVLSRGRWGERDGKHIWKSALASFVIGALVIGALRPTNTWDLPTYLALAIVALIYTLFRYESSFEQFMPRLTKVGRKLVVVIDSVLLLVALVVIAYQPFSKWYGQAYNSVDLWTGERSPFWSYTTHWGVFLFIIGAWMAWEIIDWMAKTPVSALARLKPYRGYIQGAAILIFAAIVGLYLMGVQIGWLVVILMLMALLLLLRPELPDSKRIVLFMIGTGLALTLMVELVVLKGDVGRMNTVFKFYIQAWVLFAISAGVSLGWLWQALPVWRAGWRNAFLGATTILIMGAALFPLLATPDKIRDRMAPDAPHTLDGMTYMAYAYYADQGAEISLKEDYDAIRWMQQNIQGSPVIVEANTPEYRWGTRYTIYTGLPGVVGWNWHQRQQRGFFDGDQAVWDRVNAVGDFYQTTDVQFALDFLNQYNVKYIVVGQLEEVYYSPDGLAKFQAYDGKYWKEIYREGNTTIYQVLQTSP